MAMTKSNGFSQLALACKVDDLEFKKMAEDTPNFLSLVDDLRQAYDGDHINSTDSAYTNIRTSYSDSLVRPTLDAILQELARVGYNSSATDAETAIDDIRTGMAGLSETIKARDITPGTITVGGSNSGNGLVHRLYTDINGDMIESIARNPGTLKFRCISDKNNGETEGREVFEVKGDGKVPLDNIDLGNTTSADTQINATSSVDGILSNGGFENDDGATPAVFDNWTADTPANVDKDETDFYRGTQSCNLADNVVLTQRFNEFARTIDQTLPTVLVIHYMRKASCDGTLTIRLGSQTESVSLSTATNDVWTRLVLGLSTSTKGWYTNFNEDDSGLGLRVQVSLSGRTTGNCLVDEFIMTQPTEIDGWWYFVSAGKSSFLVQDEFSYATTTTNTGQIQSTLARKYDNYLPHTTGVPTYADAT